MPTIRLANDDDEPAVTRLLSASHADAQTASCALDGTEQIIIAQDDSGNAIGLVTLRVERPSSEDTSRGGEVTTLYVTPANRRQKIAMLLLAEAERLSRDQGIAEVTVLTATRSDAAQAFFRAMDYTPHEQGFKKQLPPKRSAKSRRAEG